MKTILPRGFFNTYRPLPLENMSHPQDPPVLQASQQSLIDLQDDVREYFGWNESDDRDSALKMILRVENMNVERWSRHNRAMTLSRLFRRLVIRKPKLAILGAAVEPEEILKILTEPILIVAADGAAGVFSEIPSTLAEKAWSRMACIVSDADGGEGTTQAVHRAVPIILHAHGDNMHDWDSILKISECQPNPPELVLTHQTSENIPGMHNPGGFTDGDRAACFLTALGVDKGHIKMLGTRSDLVGRWSGKTQDQIKIRKLQWMKKFLSIQGLLVD